MLDLGFIHVLDILVKILFEPHGKPPRFERTNTFPHGPAEDADGSGMVGVSELSAAATAYKKVVEPNAAVNSNIRIWKRNL